MFQIKALTFSKSAKTNRIMIIFFKKPKKGSILKNVGRKKFVAKRSIIN